MSQIQELLDRLTDLPPQKKAELDEELERHTAHMLWVPNPGPQTDAYLCTADVLLYGGQAGGGKTHLELGWGINTAESGIIFRRERTQTDGLEKEGKKTIGRLASFNGQDLEWTWPNGKTLKLAGMKEPGDWIDHAGRERDYMAFDEAGEFLEEQIAQIMAWVRAEPGKRTRVILGSNPPRTAEGMWMLKWFAPWLDDKFPEPAVPGEIRWAIHTTKEGETHVIWVDGPGVYFEEGEEYIAKSYTFMPASLEDNPYRNTPEYKAQLQSLPEPLRSQLLYGKFATSLKDLDNQCIPTEWVRAAQARWTDKPPMLDPLVPVPMCAIGVDCTGGYEDPMVMAPRYDKWYAQIIKIPAKDIPAETAGATAAGHVVAARTGKAVVVVDMGGGYGGPLYEKLVENEIEAIQFKGAEGTPRRSKAKLGFTNKRSAAYWLFREALDPAQPNGSQIALPPNTRLLAGLTAPTFEVTPRGVQVEPKVKYDQAGKVTGGVKKKLGFSPDEADAVVQAWFEGPRAETHMLQWLSRVEENRPLSRTPRVVSGRPPPLSARARR